MPAFLSFSHSFSYVIAYSAAEEELEEKSSPVEDVPTDAVLDVPPAVDEELVVSSPQAAIENAIAKTIIAASTFFIALFLL